MMRPLSLRAYLLLFVGALLLPLGGLLVWQAHAEFEANLASARQASLNLAQLAAAHYSQFLADSEHTLQRLAQRPQVRALDPARCDPVLRDFHELKPLFTNVALMRRDGTLICSSLPAPGGRPISLATMPWFEDMRDAAGFNVTEPFRGQVTARPVIVFSYPVRDSKGAIAGRVGMSVDLARFQGVMDSLSIPAGTVLSLLSRQGALLARVPPLPEQLGLRQGADIVEHTGVAADGTAEEAGLDGIRRVYGFTHIEWTAWQVHAGIPEEQVLAPAYRNAARAAMTYLTVVLLLLLFVWILYRWMTHAVQVLGAVTAAARRGDSSGLPQTVGPAELRDTVEAFSSMLAARLQGEAALREKERSQATLLANLPGLAYRCRNDRDWTTEFMSAAAETLTGYTPDQFTGRQVSYGNLIHSEDRERVWDTVQRALARGQRFHMEYRIRRASGEERWVWEQGSGVFDAEGRLHAIEGFIQDITERKRAEDGLRLSNERYELVSRATNDAVWDWDLVSGALHWGGGFQTLFGYAPEMLERGIESWTRRLHPDDLARVEGGIYRVINGGGVAWSDEYRFRRADGSYADIFDRGSVIRDAAGKAVRMVGAMMDITERKAQQAKIVRLSRAHAVLSGINNLIVRAHSRVELLQEACRIAVEQGLFPAAWIGLREGDQIRPAAVYGEPGGSVTDIAIRFGSGDPAARALRDGQPAMSNDVLNDAELAPWHPSFRALGYNSYVVYPLFVGGEVIGCLFLYGRESRLFDEAELKLLSQLAGDISYAMEYITKEEALGNLALYDPLTRLPNRTLFIQRLDGVLSSARDYRKPLAVLMFDVDRFKYINDLVNRAGGDELLKKIAERLKRIAGGSEHLARIGSDRFAAAIPLPGEAASPAAVLKAGAWELLESPYQIGGQELKITLKFGTALFPADGEDAESLLRNAEAALKHARSSSQRQARYTREMGAAVAEKLKLEGEIRRALERGEFLLHYQPKVDLTTGAVCGAEALIRWNSPERGMVPPLKFIGLIEETGQILDVGRWVLQQAASDYRAWVEAGLHPPRLSVNVSQAQLLQPDFVELVKGLLAERACSLADIELEITESMLMTDLATSTGKLQALRDLGASIVMDDFGTGYSSLSALAQLPLTAIKIDRSFIAGMVENPNTMTIVSTIIALAHSMKLKVVAEGVDAPRQLKILRRLRCDELQGFLFSPAVPGERFIALLKEGRRL